ncbi:hypothetical protein BBO99_00006288 [Phytophthora kernoviae]|uniref:Ubiquitin-like protease family profile domain-containing protein n=2 Tax=Phytophthora kernoviae TaxID=325452 RepID=A0A3R7J5T6_9STRA|nr:hypothetical protein G195_007199 [Phytophthora kernoviae 00238/432]KAG2527002.1 hypothetical protein JM16_002357 [Phytophthora kernoviae]KAG2528495.1 hypothetical protein JM18_003040 [Phytophthora kernoviae]RLN20453.1 hypothetical protein BBI17_006413 [Phytophthora kernoviae]RLN78004.1 hypothetical protein BBO99_00006288 [Phytophthora kernoviae]
MLNSLSTFSARSFSLRDSIRPTRLGKRRVTTEGSAAEPISLDSDSDSEPEVQLDDASKNTSTAKAPTDLTKRPAEDEEEKEAAIDLKEIEKLSTAKIYGCEVMIGLFQCMADLFFQNDRMCMGNVRGKYEKWPFKPYYLLGYDHLHDVRLYGMSKESDADTEMEIEEPDKMEQLLDEASFLVFKCPLPEEEDRTATKSFYDPTDSDEDSDDGIPVLTYPLPPCTSDIVTIIRHDVSRLKSRRYLNDNIIDYYFKRMMLEDFRANEIVQEKVLFLSSHFYSRLRVGKGPTQAARLEAGLHWSLAVIVNPRLAATHRDDNCIQDEAFSCIAVLDPLGSYHRKAAIVRNLRAFLRLEWETYKGRLGKEDGATLPQYGTDRVLTISVKAPQQQNSYDCGVYVLKFAEVMLKNCVELELLSQNDGVISMEVTDAKLESLISPTAFSPEDISATRKQIRQHIGEDAVKFQELMEQKQQQKAV